MWAAVGAVPTSIIGIVMEIIQMHPDLLTPSLPGGNIFKFKQTVLDGNSKSGIYSPTLVGWINIIVLMSGYLISRQIKEWQWVLIIENCFHAIWKLNLFWVPLCQIIDRSGLRPSPTYKLLLTSSKSSIRINTQKFKKMNKYRFFTSHLFIRSLMLSYHLRIFRHKSN